MEKERFRSLFSKIIFTLLAFAIMVSLSIHDDDGKHIGVISIDVLLDETGDIVTNAAFSEGGYGLLAAQDLTIIAYTNQEFVGKRMDDPEVALSAYTQKFLNNEVLYEERMKNWIDEDVIAFSRNLPNG